MPDESLQHLRWIESVVLDLQETKIKEVSPDWDSRESYIASKLVSEAGTFTNLTSAEKRDIFLYLLGRIVEDQ